jgi:hypothetical protein
MTSDEKWGVQVTFDGDYLWVLDNSKQISLGEFDVLLFDSKEQAEEHAEIWGKSVRVKRYQ